MTQTDAPVVSPVAALRQAAFASFQRWSSAPDLRVLAVATTDLGGVPVSVAVLDAGGTVLLDTLVYTTEPIHPRAEIVHRIGEAHMADAPSFKSVQDQLAALLSGHPVVAYSAGFAGAAFVKAAEMAGYAPLETLSWEAVQEPTAVLHGSWSEVRQNHRFVSLPKALDDLSIETGGMKREGTALGNAQRLLALVHRHGQRDTWKLFWVGEESEVYVARSAQEAKAHVEGLIGEAVPEDEVGEVTHDTPFTEEDGTVTTLFAVFEREKSMFTEPTQLSTYYV